MKPGSRVLKGLLLSQNALFEANQRQLPFRTVPELVWYSRRCGPADKRPDAAASGIRWRPEVAAGNSWPGMSVRDGPQIAGSGSKANPSQKCLCVLETQF
jgi:hypothetical protein